MTEETLITLAVGANDTWGWGYTYPHKKHTKKQKRTNMKKITAITTILLLSIGFAANAQTAPTKHLPAKVTITLTAQQVLRLDSATQVISGNIDSKRTTEYILSSFTPIWQQVQKQMVVDTVKKVGGGK